MDLERKPLWVYLYGLLSKGCFDLEYWIIIIHLQRSEFFNNEMYIIESSGKCHYAMHYEVTKNISSGTTIKLNWVISCMMKFKLNLDPLNEGNHYASWNWFF